jgi:23S rRNA pseudouridine2605 synthase
LSPILHQRRATRGVTEYRPERGTGSAWTSGQDEARELRAYDRIREEPVRGRKPAPRNGREVNGNVATPERTPGNAKRRGKGRRVAPGQELPSVRTWFAGESREGSPRPGGRRGLAGATTGNRGAAGGRSRGAPAPAVGSPYTGTGANGNRAPANRPAQAGRGPGGNRPPGNARPKGHGGRGGNRPPGRGGNRSGNR